MRSGNACLTLFAACILIANVSTTPARDDDPGLVGRVLDLRGDGLPDATVFVTRVGRAPREAESPVSLRLRSQAAESPDRVVKTAPDGSFAATLPQARYRIAVFKPGYDVAFAEVNLAARRRLEIRVRPADAPASVTSEGDLDWILRQSGGDVLRALEPGPAPGVGAPVDPPAARRTADPFAGEVLALVSGGAFADGGGAGSPTSRSAQVSLRGDATDRSAWNFEGRSGRREDPWDEARAVGHERTDLRGGLAYRPRPGDDVDAEVRYASGSFSLDDADGTLAQRQGAAGVRGRWEHALDGGARRVQVLGSWREARLQQPSEVAPDPGDDVRADRSLAAGAGMEMRSTDHEVGVLVLVQDYRLGLDDGGVLLARAGPDPGSFVAEGRGRRVSLVGGDEWRVAGRTRLAYGLGYHQDLGTGSVTMLPRVGVSAGLSDAEDFVLRSSLTYRIDDAGGGPYDAGRPRDASRLGYEIGVERRAVDRLQFSATLSYLPYREPGAESPGGADVILVETDDASARQQMEFEVHRVFGPVRGGWSGSVGRVSGRVGPVFEEGPVVALQTGEARYYLTGLRGGIL